MPQCGTANLPLFGWQDCYTSREACHFAEDHAVEDIITSRLEHQFFNATAPASPGLKIDSTVKSYSNQEELCFFVAIGGMNNGETVLT